MGGTTRRKTEKMSDVGFRMMNLAFGIIDLVFPHVRKRIRRFGVCRGMTVVDYGCGPGRYAVELASVVGNEGVVYALDIHELAIRSVENKIRKKKIKNIRTGMVTGHDDGKYDTHLPDNTADLVCALDMFFIIKDPTAFLDEIARIMKDAGVVILDDGHQSREETRRKLGISGRFKVVDETRDHLKCVPA